MIKAACIAALFALPLLAGCGSSTQGASNPAPATGATGGLTAQVASSDLAVGTDRFTFGIIDNDRPVTVPSANLEFLRIRGSTGTVVERRPARFSSFTQGLKHDAANSAAFEIKGVYVAYPMFHQAGKWGTEIRFAYRGKQRVLRATFTVSRHSQSPLVGSPAPRSHNPTTAQKPAYLLDSGRPPDDMHKLSIASAIAQHKPLVIIFATPGFCESRLCGPETQIVQGLEKIYRSRVNFIHIEIYKNANPQNGYAPTVTQWGLQTEPWVFVVNRRGIISAKFEGPTPANEIEPAINRDLR